MYEAKLFTTEAYGVPFKAAGTLCGHIDFVVGRRTYSLSVDEAMSISMMLQKARKDVLENSDPLGDPRLIEPRG